MTRGKFDVNNLRIASPCSADWASMTGNDRQRFCDLCQLNVYNFSEMTAAKVRKLVIESEGRVCGQLYRRADGTVLTKDCPVGFRAYQKRVARFAGAALTAILGLFSISFGQKANEKTVDDSKVKITRTISRENILIGTIFDINGAIVPNAEIKISKDNNKLMVKSDEEGVYKILSLSAGVYSLEANLAGLGSYKIDQLEIKDKEQISLDIILESENVLMGDVTIAPSANLPDVTNLKLEKLKPKKSKKLKTKN